MAFGTALQTIGLSAIPFAGPFLAAANLANRRKRAAPPTIAKGSEKVVAATDKASGRGGALSLAGVATDAELEAVHSWAQRELDADEARLDAIEAQLAQIGQAAMQQPKAGGFFGGGGGGGFGGILPLLLLTGGFGGTSSLSTTDLLLLMALGGLG